MSMPLEQQHQQPPPMALSDHEAYKSHSGSGSIGPVIAVLAVIMIVGVIAGIIGRLCSGRRIMGYGQFDLDGWIERKCSSCIDGRIGNPTAGNGVTEGGEDVPIAIPIQTTSETKKKEDAHQNPSENLGS